MRRPRLAVALAVLIACTACVTLPESGPVSVGTDVEAPDQGIGFPYDPKPPQPGETPTEIVRHFLDAMTASPITTSVARQFLTDQARESWRPDEAMITYADVTTPLGGSDVRVDLLGAHRLDDRGAWQGALDGDAAALNFEMTTEKGEWRIRSLPDAMVVPESWFEDRYAQMSVYFFDPTGEVLVGEPVFVPRGGQTATALLRGLLRGPSPDLVGVEQSFVPAGLSLDTLVPAPADGLAEIDLTGEVAALDPQTVELMTVQFAWTLRQVPGITRFRISLNGTPLTSSGLRSDVDVSVGEPFDPAVPSGWQDGFGIRDNHLVVVSAGGESVVSGPFGADARDFRSLGISLNGVTAAGVSANGTAVQTAPVEGDATPVTVWRGTDLLKPAWDHTGALWLLDRTAGGARVRIMANGRSRAVRVPGISGEQVVDFLVSRDGSRLVAIVDDPAGDRVVVSRLNRRHRAVTGTPARLVWGEAGEQLVLRDLAWRTPTEVLAVRALDADLSQVVRRSLDGSTALPPGVVATELVRDRVRQVASTPVSGRPAWASGRSGSFHLVASDGDGYLPRDGLRALTYVG